MSHCLTCFTFPPTLAACLLCVVVCFLVGLVWFCVVLFSRVLQVLGDSFGSLIESSR